MEFKETKTGTFVYTNAANLRIEIVDKSGHPMAQTKNYLLSAGKNGKALMPMGYYDCMCKAKSMAKSIEGLIEMVEA